MALAALLLLLVGVGLWGLAARLQARSGLPRAHVRYDDAQAGRTPERPLVSHRYRLTGRPDYLLEERGRLIPVELKPTRRAPAPYEGDILQLAAYCLLVEETFEQRPPYGILRYAEQSWEIPFDAALRGRLLAVLETMERASTHPDLPRTHHQPARCAGCSQRHHCDKRLD